MPIQYRFVITAQNDAPFFADPERACEDIARILINRAVDLLRPEDLARNAETPEFKLTDTDVDLPAILEDQPYELPTVNGAEVVLKLVIQRGPLGKLRN